MDPLKPRISCQTYYIPGTKAANVEKENGRLKRLVADLTLDNAILKEVTRGNF